MKLRMVTLTDSVQIAGDNRRSWFADRDDAEMWLENGVLHIKRRGEHFMTSSFVGAWAAEDVKPKGIAKGVAKGVAATVSDEALK